MTTANLRRSFLLVALLASALLGGCSRGANVWVERTEKLTVPAADLRSLTVETHNGGVRVAGEADRAEIAVTARVRGGGHDRESAQACLDALEVISEPSGDGGHRLSSRWTCPRQSDWAQEVSFEIQAPQRLGLTVDTHNGGIDAQALDGDCRLVSHNGGIKARQVAGQLVVETHNGSVTASVTGSTVDLQTHNGAVHLDATGTTQLGGQVITYNGGVRVDLGKNTATNLACETYNGSVHCSADLGNMQATRSRVSGQVNGGGPELAVRTHNGGVRINQ